MMKTVRLDDVPDAINIEALDGALREALGDGYLGLSLGGSEGPRLHLADGVTAAGLRTARALAAEHDAAAMTPEQTARAEREALLAALTAQVAGLDLAQPLAGKDADVVLRWLALRAL